MQCLRCTVLDVFDSSSRIWPKDKVQLRPQAIRRAHLHHACRLYLNGFYRRRGAVEDNLIKDLASLCLSPYVRVRKSAQGSLHRVCSIYIRSTRMVLPIMYSTLVRGTDPDRMKGQSSPFSCHPVPYSTYLQVRYT